MVDRVLFLTHVPPYPASSGDAVRNLNLMLQLRKAGWRVSLFSLEPQGPLSNEARAYLEAICEHVITAPSRPQGARSVGLATLARRPYQPEYFWTEAAAQVLSEHLGEHEYDVQMMQIVYMSRFSRLSSAPTVFDSHNAEGLRLRSMADAAGLRPRGLAARFQIGPSMRLERHLMEASLRTLAVSEEDARYFDRLLPGRVELVPNGVDVQSRHTRTALPQSRRILFVGSLDYSANVDAVQTLAASILPLLPCVGVDVAGRNPPSSLKRLSKTNDITFHGFVPDLKKLIEGSRVMVVPLRFGGGTRLKILEAFALGIPVVSTSAGCAGLEVVNERHLLIADKPADFAAAIERLMNDDALCHRLAAEARHYVETVYDWRIIGRHLDEVLRSALCEAALQKVVA